MRYAEDEQVECSSADVPNECLLFIHIFASSNSKGKDPEPLLAIDYKWW